MTEVEKLVKDLAAEIESDGWVLRTHTMKFDHNKSVRVLTIQVERNESPQLNLFAPNRDGQTANA